MISYEKLLEKILKAVELLPEEERRSFQHFYKTNEIHGDALFPSQALAEIANDLRAAIAEQTAKAAGRGSAYKTMLRIAKRSIRDDTKCTWVQDGKQYACDGFIAIELSAPISGLPASDNRFAPLDAARVIASASQNSGSILPVPSLEALRTHIKTYKAEMKAAGNKNKYVPIDFGEDLLPRQRPHGMQ